MSQSPNELYNGFPAEEPTINIRRFFFYYLSYWKWFIASIVFFVILGGVYLWIQQPLYEINASVLIKDDKNNFGSTINLLEQIDLFSSRKIVENEMEIFRSYDLLEQVAKDLHLGVKYYWKKNLRTQELYGNSPVNVEVINATEELYSAKIVYHVGSEIVINKKSYPKTGLITDSFGTIRVTTNDSISALWDKGYPVRIKIMSSSGVTEELRKNLTVKTSGKGTSVLNLSILSPVPQKGEDILNDLLTVYNTAAIADKNNLIKTTLDFINDRLDVLAVDLNEVEQKVEDFKTSQGITDVGEEARLFLQSVQQNDNEKNKIDIQLGVLRNIEQYVIETDHTNSMTPATLGISDPTLLSLISSLSTVESERTKVLRTVKPGNPIVQAYDDQINELKRNIIDNIRTLRRSLEITLNKLLAKERQIAGMLQSLPRKERELVDITRQQEIKSELYSYLLSKREEAAISYASTLADSRVVDVARSSRLPVKPMKRVILLGILLIGVVTPVIILWLRDQFYSKIESIGEVERKLEVPIVGEVSLFPKATKILSMVKNNDRYVEQIRTLRTNIEFMQAGGVHTVLITSSISGEGKSLLAANLGVAFAALGKRTVVLGFDLRKPGIHKLFGIDNTEGLSNYLIGQNSLEQIVRKVDQVENLDIITCGHVPPNPQELLQGGVLSRLMEELKAQYDYIIIDSAPIGLVSDAQFLSHYADVSMFVIRYKYTPKDRIRWINNLYRERRIGNLCITVNGIDEKKWYGYDASYGSSKYYGNYYGKAK